MNIKTHTKISTALTTMSSIDQNKLNHTIFEFIIYMNVSN